MNFPNFFTQDVIENDLFHFRFPSTTVVSGPTLSGKTTLVRKLLKCNIYGKDIKSIMWCYSTFQQWFLEERNINFHQGLPQAFENNADIIVIDDLLESLNEEVSRLFTVTSHHGNKSVILLTQNLFPKNKIFRNITLNTHYLILFGNNRDSSQIQCLSRQMFPSKSKYFIDAYKKATENPYGHLLIDCHPLSNKTFRLRDSCFPDFDGVYWVYVPSA